LQAPYTSRRYQKRLAQVILHERCAPRVRLMTSCLKVNSHAASRVLPPSFPSSYLQPRPAWWTSLYPLWSQSLHGLRSSINVSSPPAFLARPLRFPTKRNWGHFTPQSFCDVVQLAGAYAPRRISRDVCPRSGPQLRAIRGSDLRCAFFPSHAPILSSPCLPASDFADPNLECTPYYYAPSGQFVNTFPPIWQPATLLANDTEGQALWAKISPSIPTNILPKGQLNGSTINVTYNSVNDPDCCELPFSFQL